MRNEPILISFLVRLACAKMIQQRLEQSLNLVGFQDSQLRSLQEQFAAAKDQPWPARAFAGERAFGLSFFINREIQHAVTAKERIGGLPSGLPGNLALTAYRGAA